MVCDVCGENHAATTLRDAVARGWQAVRLGDGIERHACRPCVGRLGRDGVRVAIEEEARVAKDAPP